MTNIGVFDSGLGGLTVLSELVKNKKANYFYFGDALRVPYGNREDDEIIEFSEQIVDFLEQFDIDFYVIACNTMSITSADILRNKYKKEFYSIADAGLESTKDYEGDYLVLGTKSTVLSHYYKKAIENISSNDVYEVACIKFVDLIESGYIKGEILDQYAKEYLKIANDKKIPNIILACTHYPIILDTISKNLSYEANIINPANYISSQINIEESKESFVHLYMSEISDNARELIDKIITCDYELKLKEL